jgi:hypothetical protein
MNGEKFGGEVTNRNTEKPRCRCGDNIKMDLGELGFGCVVGIQLA